MSPALVLVLAVLSLLAVQASAQTYSFCYKAQSSPSSLFEAWSESITGTLAVSGSTITSGSATRVLISGSSNTVNTARLQIISPAGTGSSADNTFLSGSPYVDSHGWLFGIVNSTENTSVTNAIIPSGIPFLTLPNGFAVTALNLVLNSALDAPVESGGDVPGTATMTVSTGTSISCSTPLASTPVHERIQWTFCYTESQNSGSPYGPFTVNYVGQFFTNNYTSVSPISGQTGYMLLSARGTRTQINSAGVVVSNSIIGLGSVQGSGSSLSTERNYDPYLFLGGFVENKTATSFASISSAGVVFVLDNGPILPNGYQTSTQVAGTSEAWLSLAPNGQVVETFFSEFSSSGAQLPTSSYVYPTSSSLVIASVSAPDYVVESAPLPNCPLNFAVFASSSSASTTTYQICAAAVSSISSPAAPWALSDVTSVTVSAFPTLVSSTGQYGFSIVSLQSGTYSQSAQGQNSSSSISSASAASLYLSQSGLWSLDQSGFTQTLASAIRLPSASFSSQAQSQLILQGGVPSPALTSSPIVFSSLSAPWTNRLIPGFNFIIKPVNYATASGAILQATAPKTALIYGGQFNTTQLYNDVWISTDSCQTWTLIGGQGATAAQNALATPFVPLNGAIKIQDALGRLYLLGGNYTSIVQYSDDGLHWSSVVAPWHGRAYTGAIASPLGPVFIFGGQGMVDDHTGASGTYLNDCWMSTNQGLTWSVQTLAAAWDIRDSLMGASYYSPQLQKTVLINSGGHDDTSLNFRPNEVWGSSDMGVTWSLFPRAPYVGRNHAAMRQLSNGVLIVVAGKTDEAGVVNGVTNANLGLNDVWVSLTGGTSWSLCTNMAQFPPRQDLAATVDSAGYLYVSSGIQGQTEVDLADMWKSSISFLDLNAISQACGGIAPSPCGIGLRCWPTPGLPYNCPCDFDLKGEEAPSQSQLVLTPLTNPYTLQPSSLPSCSLPAAAQRVVVQPVPVHQLVVLLPDRLQQRLHLRPVHHRVRGPVHHAGQPDRLPSDRRHRLRHHLRHRLPHSVQRQRRPVRVRHRRPGQPAAVRSQPQRPQVGQFPVPEPAGDQGERVHCQHLQLRHRAAAGHGSHPALRLPAHLHCGHWRGSQPEEWLFVANGEVVEGYLSQLTATGTARSPPLYPTYGSMSIVSISAVDFVTEAPTLPSCPLNFALFTASAATTTYQFCASAFSAALSPSAPWALEETANITVSAIPSFNSVTQQYSFPIQSVSSGFFADIVKGSASSATSQPATFSTRPQLYLTSYGTWTFDTTGLTLQLNSPVRLPTTTGLPVTTSTLTLTGYVPSPAVAASPISFSSLTAPWSPRLIPGFNFILNPITYALPSGTVTQASGSSVALIYGGQFSTTVHVQRHLDLH